MQHVTGKKNLAIKRWEVGEGAELDKAECRGFFHKMHKSLLLTSKKIVCDKQVLQSQRNETSDKISTDPL